jgi:hypothetical protein
MAGITALEQFMTFAGNLAQVNPTVLDKVDLDEAVDKMGDMLGVAPSVIISDDKVAEKRQADAQQQQMQQAAMYAQEAAKGAKTLSDTQVGTGSALDALMPGLGGGMQ